MTQIEELVAIGPAAEAAAHPTKAQEVVLEPGPRRVGRARYAASYLARRPGLLMSILWMTAVVLAAFVPSLFTSASPLAVGAAITAPPSWHHLFGTDQIGRDLFSRVVYGSSLSMRASLIAVLVGLLLGGPLGLVAGYVGGPLDAGLMRVVDVLLSIPALLLSLAVVLALGFGLTDVALAVGVAFIASSARVTRGEVLKIRQSPYVEAARAGGARQGRVLVRHVLPSAVEPLLVLAALEFGEAILYISTLSFLGYGVQPPAPEWGSLVADGRDYLNTAWWLTTMPGLTIVVTVLAANRISRAFGRVDR
ncbi:MAG TPA: ABC transporter permease [Acidimicrobiales bacterium]|nr:ABC transporter permease [Acidimicrobiales bacterium]